MKHDDLSTNHGTKVHHFTSQKQEFFVKSDWEFLSIYLLIINILYYVFIVFYCYFLEHWESDG